VAVYDIKRERRHFHIEFFELVEERAREVKVFSILKRVEFVGPPALGAPDHLRFLLRIVGDDGLFAGVAGAFIEGALIPHRKPPRVPAVGAKGGRGDAEARIEGGIIRCDFELMIAAFTIHWIREG